MTPEQEMQAIVEAAGERWYKNQKGSFAGVSIRIGQDNPSPTDLNELFRLADKLGHDEIFFTSGRGVEFPQRCLLENFSPIRIQYEGKSSTRADALRKSLVQAVTEVPL